ncbi:DUF58 domain-containing protein [Ideonella sp.]|uniref:DUF58 domain-containing protein n=1 Tax=Ideonella sp. TaxID=1929293 RepID=UPI003BB65F31
MIGPRETLRRWWLSRLKPVARHALAQRNIYIVPTRAGLAYALTLLLLLLASINYQLSLGYALTFLLAGSALASMHMAHASLRGLELHLRPPQPTHVGRSLVLEVLIDNPSSARHGVGLGMEGAQARQTLAWCELPAQSQSRVTVSQLAAQRGFVELPALRIESRFPFGLFRAWSVWRPAGNAWIYPAPEQPATELPAAEPIEAHAAALRASRSGEFDGVRPWRQGDGLRQVVWKKVAHSGAMVSRDSQQSVQQQLWLDWRQTPAGDAEARLSRLTAWVLQADLRGLRYGLRLPGAEIACGDGAGHREQVLQALASWSR